MNRDVDWIVYKTNNVVPKNIDVIRSLAAVVKEELESIRMTDEVLGIQRDFLVK